MSPELGDRVVGDARKIVQALGYDMNSIEFAIKDGVPYAIDFMNPAPDMDVNSLTPHYFDWVVNAMADMAIRLATQPRKQILPSWEHLFMTRPAGGVVEKAKAMAKKAATKATRKTTRPASKKAAPGKAAEPKSTGPKKK
jgi:hypothetical protein